MEKTTTDIKRTYVYGVCESTVSDIEDAELEFDRWYTAEIEAAEKRGAVRIWREGYQRGVLDGTFDLDPADNPYRGGDS